MQKLAEICIRRPVFATMLILSLVVVGTAGYFNLGVDRVPSVDLPTLFIRTSLPGASPETVETEVSQRIEEVVNTVEGLEELRSISSQGQSFVIATFKLSRNIDVAAQDVRDRVSSVMRQLPEDIDPPVVQKRNNDDDPVMSIAVYGPRTRRELTEYAERVIKERLERSVGVGEVQVTGGTRRAINVWVDPDKLVGFNLPVTAVRDAIVRQNADVPGGNVTGNVREQQLRTMGKLTDAKDFADLVVKTVGGQPIRVKDVGYAEDGTKELRSVARLWKRDKDSEKAEPLTTVSLDIKRQSGANSVEVVEGVKAQLKKIEDELPPDVKIEVIRDQSTYIYEALHEINVHLWAGSGLACLVVLAFMRNWRSTLIAAVAIPASVVSTFGMMWALDFTLNSVTMLALVLMVGVVIDDAIVVLENIFRFIEEKGMAPIDAAREATREIGLAVLATTLSLVIIFIPVSFMSSISGRFLYQFGITAAVAVMVSLLVSFTLTPMMSARMLKAAKKKGEGEKGGQGEGEAAKSAGAAAPHPVTASSLHQSHATPHHASSHASASRTGFYKYIDAAYTWMLRWSMTLRWGVAAVALVVMWTAVPLYGTVKQEWIPSDVDEAEFQINVTGPEGTAPESMDQAMRVIEQEIMQVRGVRLLLSGGGFGLGAANSARVHVSIAPHEERTWSLGRWVYWLARLQPGKAFEGNYSQRDVMTDVRKRLAKYRDVRPQIRNYSAFSLGGSPVDIDFQIRGPDLVELDRYANQLRDMIKSGKIEGIVDADTTLKLDKPELQIVPDRQRAAQLGVDMRAIGSALGIMVGGDEQVTRFHDDAVNDDYDVQIRLVEGKRNAEADIQRLYVPRDNGELVALSNVATIKRGLTAGRIDRGDRERMVAVRAGVAPGYALGDRIEALKKAAEELRMPSAYTTSVAGKGKELERTFGEFLTAFMLSVVFMYIILAMNYESLIHPLTILLSLPLTVPFALLSLYWTDGTLNLYSALGILVLFGVVKKNSILQIDHMNHLRAEGMPRAQAIIEGNRDRLRPILMTTLALVAGMLPLAIGTGPGSEERRAVAVVVIGGQSLALLLTLLVTPVAYSFFDDIGNLIRRRKTPELPGDTGAAPPIAVVEPGVPVAAEPVLVPPLDDDDRPKRRRKPMPV
ncbi:MAG TPA: efflux RND transporter permease subunit [Tepidisphaeraceae bacterium]|nr:efflux RND transporter permease subunit [Tepidisphaeraceae bacterium]